MIVLWLATGLLSGGGEPQQQPQPIYGWAWDDYAARRNRARKNREEEERREEALAKAAAEAREEAEKALSEFEESERQRYLARLDALVSKRVAPVDIDAIATAAAAAVSEWAKGLEDEFDRYVERLRFEQDEEDAVMVLLLVS